MLLELHVENFALMEKVDLTLGRGLTVFTGETGAGKSMLIDALGVLLGGRASADFIRHGEDKASVEGVFADLSPETLARLEEAGYPAEDGQLFLFREINSSGRNVCRVQGRTVPLSLYRTLCEGLVDIHGQMEHQSLLHPETHQSLVDAFGGAKQLEVLSQVRKAARQYKGILSKERQLSLSEAERQRREEFLRYQIEEIDQIKPVLGEEEQLNHEKKRLSNAERIMNLISETYVDLYDGPAKGAAAYDLIGKARKALQELARLDSNCNQMAEQAGSLYYALEDLAEQARVYREEFEFEPGRLEHIEDRLAQLHRLRKYGLAIEDVLVARAEMAAELAKIGNAQEELKSLALEKQKVLAEYQKLANELSTLRLEQAKLLEMGLVEELADLGLEKSRFEIRFTPVSDPDENGAEEAEFFFSANLGEPPKPLAKVASGGEMSRLVLALKSLLARIETVGTFIFDEVDSGVGGRTIQKVGEKLTKIGQIRQVFCITHAAQVAAFADEHYGIFKEVVGERTRTNVEKLEEAERINELARMLGGGEITLRHAQELWARCSRTGGQV